MIDFSDFRRKFNEDEITITKKDLPENPIDLCQHWLKEVKDSKLLDGNAMTLSTASAEGRVSARTVLLKFLDQSGFVFFSNYKSRKGLDLKENPHAALTFYWPILNRQICVQGKVFKLSQERSKEYFTSRPRLNQLLACSSNQDEEIQSLKEIVDKMESIDAEYKGSALPIPENWGGFVLNPTEIEFWQGGQGRLNIRYHYYLKNNQWILKQLSP